LDISNPAVPIQIANPPIKMGGYMHLLNNRIYSILTGSLLRIVDVSNPFFPQELSNLALPGLYPHNYNYLGFAGVDNFLYVFAQKHPAEGLPIPVFQIIDVSKIAR
jgi:hypothetical protein